jgi:hypothetical protein
MSEPTRERSLLRALGQLPTPPEAAEAAAARRERVVARINRLDVELEQAGRRHRRLSLVALAILPAAAALVLWFAGAGRDSAKEPTTARVRLIEGVVDVARGMRLERARPVNELGLDGSERLRTGHLRAKVVLPSGARVELSPNSEVAIDALRLREQLRLHEGRIELAVPKLGAGRTLSVRTFDALTTVHGTRFSVSVEHAPEYSAWTEVRLDEGSLSIEHRGVRTLLQAPATWSSRPVASASSRAPAPVADRLPAREEPAPEISSSARRATPAAPPAAETVALSRSTLAQENALFVAAKTAQQQGEHGQALVYLDRLLAEYPGSTHAHNARVERFRLLARMGRTVEAARAARRYLADYPLGFAKEEARRLALQAEAGSENAP